jgi:DNA-binding response OmpR family regulator
MMLRGEYARVGPANVVDCRNRLGQDTDKRLAYDAGFDQHIMKPFDPREALAALATWQKEKDGELERG